MITSQTYSNKALVRVTDGKKLGEVKDIYLDRDLHQLAAVHLGTEGFFNRNAQVVGRGAIQVYGIDAWIVSGDVKVVRLEDIPDSEALILASQLRGRVIESEGGTKIGDVEDIIFDSEARILGFSLRNVYAQGPLEERRTIARDAITSVGSKNSPMTITLTKAESLPLPSE